MIVLSRKQFLTKSILLASTLSLLRGGSEINAKDAKSKKEIPLPEGESPVSESDPTAQALGFHQDAKDTDFNLYPDRKSAQAKHYVCLSCAQFTPLNEGWGKCNILTAGVVSTKGWCSAFSKKS